MVSKDLSTMVRDISLCVGTACVAHFYFHYANDSVDFNGIKDLLTYIYDDITEDRGCRLIRDVSLGYCIGFVGSGFNLFVDKNSKEKK